MNEFTRINGIIKKYVPEKVIKYSGFPWIIHKIIKMMRRQESKRQAKKTGKDIDWNRYISVQKLVKREVHKSQPYSRRAAYLAND